MKEFELLKKASEHGSKLGLERIRELCEKLGSPQNFCKTIHIAGTNGKGSFGAMMSAILTRAGYVTGSFSSPALTDVTDSFRINCESITDAELESILADIAPLYEKTTDKPTEFEVLTAAAFELFRRKKCDIALVECGMGGDTDSTNVIESPLLSVITNIAADHTAFLGSTLKEIARHKAGIIKPRRPVLYGGNSGEALEIISDFTEKNGSELTITDHGKITVTECSIHGTKYIHEDFGALESRLPGTYQKYNISNVLTAVEMLRKEGIAIPDSAVKQGISSAQWHGRFELVSHDPIIIFDGAHNPDGIIQAAESIKTYIGGKVVLLIGVMADKEYWLYPEILGEYTDKAFTVIPDNPRSLDSDILARSFAEKNIEAQACGTVSNGLKSAVDYAKKHELPLVALGSLYMYREFINSLRTEYHEF